MEIAVKDWVCPNCGTRGGEMLAVGTARAYRCFRCDEMFVQQVGSVFVETELPDKQTLIEDLRALEVELRE